MLQHDGVGFALVGLGLLAGAFLMPRAGRARTLTALVLFVVLAAAAALNMHPAGHALWDAGRDLLSDLHKPGAEGTRTEPHPAQSTNAGNAALAGKQAGPGAGQENLAKELEAERAEHRVTREALVRAEQAREAAITGGSESIAELEAALVAAKAAHARAEAQLVEARAKLQPPAGAGGDNVGASKAAAVLQVLEAERVAHEQTRQKLQATQARVDALEAGHDELRRRLQQAEREPTPARAPSRDAGEALAKALSVMAQLEVEQAHARGQAKAAAPLVTAATATAPPPQSKPNDAATDPDIDNIKAQLKFELGQGVSTPELELTAHPGTEIVQGLKGAYYRIACRGGEGKGRLSFASASYMPADGDQKVIACWRELQQIVLAQLPPELHIRLFTQGFASDQRFVRPKPIPASDDQIRTARFLPRRADTDGYASTHQLRTVQAYTNSELVNLRGAYIANVIAKATGSRIEPDVLEGAVKPAGDDSATSFDLILFIAW